ncbi:MAG: hypothetical protein CVV58_03970 [Tenericutes bacterium HGW-Tenericutes-3]|nr:MAG: hypothetical protein CVV58_03970 [Tenericutes bacterium HGW-Tenericutes-3]
MKNIRRIYSSIILILFTGIIFGTVSYAWITLSTINNVDGISLDGINYQTELPAASIEQLFGDIKLIDVTSVDGKEFLLGGLRTVGPATPNEHYLSFELWFQTTRPEKNIFLIQNVSDIATYDSSMNGTYVVSRGVSWAAKYDFQNGPLETDMVYKGDRDTYYASDSIRISINEIKDEDNPLDTRSSEELRSFLFDPSGKPERGYGFTYGAYSYFVASSKYYIWLPTEMQVVSYRLTTFDPTNPYIAQDDDSQLAVMMPTDVVDDDGKPLYRAKVRINIWIEGWDADAFDAVEDDRVKIQLQFKVANLLANE